MKRLSRYIATILVLILFFGAVLYANTLSIKPLYTDKRFPPNDKLHAGCMHTASITLSTNYDVREVHVIMEYDATMMDVFRIMPDSKNQNEKIFYEIRNGEIQYDHTNIVYIPWYEIPLFSIMFHSSKGAATIPIVFAKGSYILTRDSQKIPLEGEQTIQFAKVPECEPDIIPPLINMVKPLESNTGVSLDSIFAFDIKDSGKGVDRSSVYITIAGDVYTISSPGVAQSGDIILVEPRSFLPVNKKVEAVVKVADKQQYGGANIVEKTFTIKTAKDIELDGSLTPAQLNRRVTEIRAKRGSIDECTMMQSIYSMINSANQGLVSNIYNKLECDVVLADNDSSTISDKKHQASSILLTEQDTRRGVSVFGVTGWILFILAIILKLNYFIAYKRKSLDN